MNTPFLLLVAWPLLAIFPEGQVLEAPASEFNLELGASGEVTSAEARNASLGEIAKTLGRALGVPVKVAPALSGKRVTFSLLRGASLQELLERLEPAVAQVDTRELLGEPQKILAVELLESRPVPLAPPRPAALVIAGHTDDVLDGPAPSEDEAVDHGRSDLPSPPDEGPYLFVRRSRDGRFSVDARDQGLGVLLFEVAEAARARFDLRVPEAPMVGRFSATGILPSDLPVSLGLPGVGVDVRRNTASGEEVLLRVFVDPVP